MKITLTGALGHISRPLAQHLLAQGHTVTIISSNAERKEIEALGGIAAIGSITDADFLARAFAEADAVYAMVPLDFTVPDIRAHSQNIGRAYAQAVRTSGVKRVVHLSSWGAHLAEGTGPIIGSYEVESSLNELPQVSVTHLRPGYFFQNLYRFIDLIKNAGFIGANYGGEDRIVFTSTKDIAKVAAEELTATGSEKIRYLASDDITASAAAQIMGAGIGKPALQWVTFTDEQAFAAFQEAGMPVMIAHLFVELGAAIHSGAIREDYDLHRPIAGETKLRDFAREFAAVFGEKVV
ncbi:NmrA family NAD(P)-binding protein [Hymenobacter sp. PAMC 26628]|uniref:NmrA family NAD(P)-binding protein n=1 Tax=Hymenobacter sp. PAMC 26628 TaxID=1484118 RepID=UPI00076FFD7B|nr:NAD(P)H-binding protein [Hymenobacter sp. PAMC 26628]AMJ67753.1 NAD-dependent dehydratase [Hymenobacter sp. PAMC 26628]